MKKKMLYTSVVAIIMMGQTSCKKTKAQATTNPPAATQGYHQVKARTNALSNNWSTYTAKTIDKLPGFSYTADPALSTYGGWKTGQVNGTGFLG
jgi:hypothetical protein